MIEAVETETSPTALRFIPQKQVVPQEQWQAVSRRAIQAAMDEVPNWDAPFSGDTNYRHLEFTRVLRANFPIHSEEDPIPAEFYDLPTMWEEYREGFLTVWYQECANMMGHLLRVPSNRSKQRTLF